METRMTKGYSERRARGFTLLELLMVVALVAIVGVGAVSLTLNTEETVGMDLAQAEIRVVRDAILQFKKDTGFLHRTGPFDLQSENGAVGIPPQGIDWFYSPANFCQLIEEPKYPNGDPIMPWNPDTGRGWHGPYLQKADVWVDVGNGLKQDGSGNPAEGQLIKQVHGIADPFLHRPDKRYFVWCNWDYDEISRYGRPYYIFDWNPQDPENIEWARIVSTGPNGIYESQELSYHQWPPEKIGDDIVVFLFR